MDFVLGTLAAAIVLFLWTGFAQNVLPWGVKSVRTVDDESIGSAIGGVSQSDMLYTTKGVAALIAVKPASYYAIGRYFAIEFVTQLLVGAALTGLMLLTVELADAERLGMIALAGLAGVFSIDLQYWNWWGFSSRYTVGLAVNRLVGYLLAGALLLAVVF